MTEHVKTPEGVDTELIVGALYRVQQNPIVTNNNRYLTYPEESPSGGDVLLTPLIKPGAVDSQRTADSQEWGFFNATAENTYVIKNRAGFYYNLDTRARTNSGKQNSLNNPYQQFRVRTVLFEGLRFYQFEQVQSSQALDSNVKGDAYLKKYEIDNSNQYWRLSQVFKLEGEISRVPTVITLPVGEATSGVTQKFLNNTKVDQQDEFTVTEEDEATATVSIDREFTFGSSFSYTISGGFEIKAFSSQKSMTFGFEFGSRINKTKTDTKTKKTTNGMTFPVHVPKHRIVNATILYNRVEDFVHEFTITGKVIGVVPIMNGTTGGVKYTEVTGADLRELVLHENEINPNSGLTYNEDGTADVNIKAKVVISGGFYVDINFQQSKIK